MIARMFRIELRDELLAIVREPVALFFSVLMPVGFFAFFVGMFGRDGGAADMLATFGTFGVLAVVLVNPGMRLSAARQTGWLRVKRVSGTPLGVTLASQVAASLPYAVIVLVAMTVAAVSIGGMELELVTVGRLIVALVVGVLPFSLFSLAVGARVGTSGAAAVLNGLLLPLAIASGLWFPLDMLPEVVGRIANVLPTYHLAQLGIAQVGATPWAPHAAVLAATAAVGAVAAGLAYRSARP